MPQKSDGAIRLSPLEPEEQVDIPHVLGKSDPDSSQTSVEEQAKASFEDDSKDEAVP